jgi:hypothetical protein
MDDAHHEAGAANVSHGNVLALGAHANATVGDSVTALIGAASCGDVERVGALLAAGVQVNSESQGGVTALMSAAMRGRIQCVRALLAAGARVDAKNNDGRTALMDAAMHGHANSVSTLLAAGAEMDSKDNHGRTAFTLASSHGHAACAALFVDALRALPPPHSAGPVLAASTWLHPSILTPSAPSRWSPRLGPSHEAVYSGNVDGVVALLAAGAQVARGERPPAPPAADLGQVVAELKSIADEVQLSGAVEAPSGGGGGGGGSAAAASVTCCICMERTPNAGLLHAADKE